MNKFLLQPGLLTSSPYSLIYSNPDETSKSYLSSAQDIIFLDKPTFSPIEVIFLLVIFTLESSSNLSISVWQLSIKYFASRIMFIIRSWLLYLFESSEVECLNALFTISPSGLVKPFEHISL